jgi:hypothetical protein
MAAPAYTWEFNCDLFGTRVPVVTTMEAAASLETKVGTLLSMVSGQLAATTDGTADKIFGLAMEATTAALSAADPVKVAIIAPGMVIKGTAVDTAASTSGFTSKAQDLDADGRLDPDDVTGGGLSTWRTEDSGLTVYCVVCAGAII